MSAEFDPCNHEWVIDFADISTDDIAASNISYEVVRSCARIARIVKDEPIITVEELMEVDKIDQETAVAIVDRVTTTAINTAILEGSVRHMTPLARRSGGQVDELLEMLRWAGNKITDIYDQRVIQSLLGHFATEFEVEAAHQADVGRFVRPPDVELPIAA